MDGNKKRITLHLRNHKDITIFLERSETIALIDQIYDVFSGELTDNTIEIMCDSDVGREVILVRADEVIYVKTQEEQDE